MPSTSPSLERASRTLARWFGLLLGVLLALTAFALWNFHHLSLADSWKAHTYQVLLESQKVKENLFLMDSSVRAYIVTGKQEQLNIYHEGDRGFNEHLNELRRLVIDNPAQEERLSAFAKEQNEWQKAILEPTLATREPSASLLQALGAAAKTAAARAAALERLRRRLDDIETVERNLLTVRAHNQERSRELTERLLWIGSAFSLLLTAFLSSLALRALRESSAAYVRLRLANDELSAAQRGLEQEIEQRRAAQELLRRSNADLKRSNAELEQFAYVASHDLQEPLRAVAGCVQVLKRRYEGQLDARADQFIGHAVDGAQRMQNLIQDLLAFSRVGTRGKPFVPVKLDEVLDSALRNLKVAIEESGARIEREPLPSIEGDAGQLEAVFQNLLSNALKFRGEAYPYIVVRAQQERSGASEDGWTIQVQDNGVGIEPQYFERIFVMFQRLHTRDNYPGTGIGLAIVKKVIERHGGRIWVQSTPGQGTTFGFWLPRHAPAEAPLGEKEEERDLLVGTASTADVTN